ncbi:hypothetical protein [Actinomadura monticuli]|uniref:DUF5302 domain-containing protein n=1 Tax=Actinomadura monticuli TaxID=3097367 RepID=A0ABV4Q7D9_9ACTN
MPDHHDERDRGGGDHVQPPLRPDLPGPGGQAPHQRFEAYQDKINAERGAQERVIDEHRDKFGDEYRLETDGPHPVGRLRDKPAT